MKKLLKIENLLIVFYGLFAVASGLALFYFRLDERLAMPIFIGMFGILPFVIYFRSANRISPFVSKIFVVIYAVLAVTFLIPYLKFTYCLPIPLLIVFMFIIRRERRVGFERWLKANKYSSVPNPPEDVLQALGHEKNWQCFANSFFPENGREVPHLIWFGSTTTSFTSYVNGSPVHSTTLVPHLAFSFFPQVVSEKFKQRLTAMNLENNSFVENLKPSAQEKQPYLTKTLADGTFVCAWTTLHVASLLDEKVAELKAMLED